MEIIRKDMLHVDFAIKPSAWSTIKGTLIVLFFGGFGYWGYADLKMPLWPTILILIATLIILMFVVNEWRMFFKDKFLIGFYGTKLVLPLNHSIKNAHPDLDLFLVLDPKVIKKIQVRRVSMRYPTITPGAPRVTNRFRSETYLRIELAEPLEDSFYSTLTKIIRQEGFQGSPIYPSCRNDLDYLISEHDSKIKAIRRHLKERLGAVYEPSTDSLRLHLYDDRHDPLSKDKILKTAHRLYCHGDMVYHMLIVQRNYLSKEEVRQFHDQLQEVDLFGFSFLN